LGDIHHLPQTPNFEPQYLLSVGRQVIFAPRLAPFEFSFGFADHAIGQQAIEVCVESSGPKLEIATGLPLDGLHDPVPMQIRLGERQKDM